MAMSLDVSSLDRKLLKLSGVGIQQALDKSAILVENEAKNNCPVDTGQLRGSITHEVSEGHAEIGTNVEYAPYVEFGTGLFAINGDGRLTPWVYQDAKGEWHYTSGQQPQPYLEPALVNNTDSILQIFRDTLEQEIANNARL